MKKIALTILSLMVVGMPLSLLAAPAFFLDDDANFSNNDPIADDAYIVGNNIEITREVKGDLIVIGGEVIVTANVTGDLMVLAGKVNVNGKVGDDIRVAAGEVTINNEVGDDLLVGSGRIVLSDTAVINGEAAINAREFNQFGTVKGNLRIKAEQVRINGLASGDADIRFGDELTFGQNGRINGTLRYWARDEVPDVVSHAGKVEFNEDKGFSWVDNYANKTGGFVWKVITVMFMGGILMWLLPKYLPAVLKKGRDNIWGSLGAGAAILFLLPIVAILLLVTVVGAPLAIFLGLAWVAALLFSGVVVSYYIGSLIRKNHKDGARDQMYNLLVGAVALALLDLIPVAGGLVQFILLLVALGAMWAEKKAIVAHYR